jgi:hypothetical protein
MQVGLQEVEVLVGFRETMKDMMEVLEGVVVVGLTAQKMNKMENNPLEVVEVVVVQVVLA